MSHTTAPKRPLDRPARRETYRRPTLGQRTRLIIRWDRILGSIALGLFAATVLIGGVIIGDLRDNPPATIIETGH